ncbi:MAG: succinate dehydrogenase, cytochrome b556 subunit [Pirellulales bacterium]|nr:succinate dehydrogenase, cytochrome b556 subunit [Pirellulales bacterium]
MADAKTQGNRPLSPHLQIYKPMLTMMMSIAHRITGAGLYLGSLLLAWWLISAATGEAYFEYVSEIAGSFIGRLVLFLATWGLIHHMLGGIRHFIWDTGRGFDLDTIEIMAKASLIGAFGLTVAVWAMGYIVMGAL